MSSMFAARGGTRDWPAHIAAGGLALAYARFVSTTPYVTTGAQFLSPVAVILLTHLVWLWARRRLDPGFARAVFARSLATAFMIGLATALANLYAPMPAEAGDLGESIGSVLGALACLVVLCVVLAVAAGFIYIAYLILATVFRALRRAFGGRGDGGSTLQDFGAIGIALLAIGLASLEGIADALTGTSSDGASVSMLVAAPPEKVWRAVGTATSPNFPLPFLLKSIPQPVMIVADEGADLGARRVVRFRGREGEGDLALQVTRRTETEAEFTAQADGSPIAGWVRQKAIVFHVEPAAGGSMLIVSTRYNRLLAPGWFFGPYIRLAATFAVDVLARDTRERAQAM